MPLTPRFSARIQVQTFNEPKKCVRLPPALGLLLIVAHECSGPFVPDIVLTTLSPMDNWFLCGDNHELAQGSGLDQE